MKDGDVIWGAESDLSARRSLRVIITWNDAWLSHQSRFQKNVPHFGCSDQCQTFQPVALQYIKNKNRTLIFYNESNRLMKNERMNEVTAVTAITWAKQEMTTLLSWQLPANVSWLLTFLFRMRWWLFSFQCLCHCFFKLQWTVEGILIHVATMTVIG